MKERIKITKENIIREVAKQTGNTTNETRQFYNVLESIIFDNLHSVNENQDVYLKLFEGISLNGSYVPEKRKKNNLTGKTTLVDSKIKPKFNITRSYCEKLNDK